MKVLCVFGRYNYGDSSRGESPEYSAFVPALQRLGHEVRHFESWDHSGYASLAELNAALLDQVESFRPDVLFNVQILYEIWIETLELIRARGDVATISWATDDSWKYREVSRFIGPAFDAMTTTYDYVVPSYHADGISDVLVTQWAVPGGWLAEPLPSAQCRYAVSFIGTAHGGRGELVQALAARGIDVACFGYGWPSGPIAAADIPRIMRESVISLNFANSKGQNQIKARTFEVPGAGGFLLTEDAPQLDRFYDLGTEIAVYRDMDDLVAKIRHYLDHPDERDAVAWAGYRRTAQQHTYEHRMGEVLDFARAAKARHPHFTTRANRDQAMRVHRLTAGLKVLRSVLVGAGSAVYGPKRGPRAARRLVFELSWRWAGRHTFTAAGWPGRMFPRD